MILGKQTVTWGIVCEIDSQDTVVDSDDVSIEFAALGRGYMSRVAPSYWALPLILVSS